MCSMPTSCRQGVSKALTLNWFDSSHTHSDSQSAGGTEKIGRSPPTVLNGVGGDFVLGLLVVLGLDLDNDVVALRKAGVAASLEAVAVGRTGVCGLEGGPLALVVLRADEGEHLGHGCGGFCG